MRYTEDGKDKQITEHLALPADLANGMVATLMKNIPADAARQLVSMVGANPKPRLVKLLIAPDGEERFAIGTSSRKAMKYVVKVELGRVAGAVVPLIGKQPQDTYVWILGGDAPTFVRSERPLYAGGPSWRLELESPVWPREDHASR